MISPQEKFVLWSKKQVGGLVYGFAFNVNSDLSYLETLFHGIVDVQVTSMKKELNKEIDMNEVKRASKTHIVNLFEMVLV